MKHQWDYQHAAQGGKTSVKIHNAPGGNSQWSIGWDQPEVNPQRQGKDYQQNNNSSQFQSSYQKASYDGYYGGQVSSENIGFAGASTKTIDHDYRRKGAQPQYDHFSPSKQHQEGDGRTSVKIHNPPGGRSNFSISNQFDEVPTYKQPALKQYDMNQGAAYGGFSQQQNQFPLHQQQQTRKEGIYGNNSSQFGAATGLQQNNFNYQQQQFGYDNKRGGGYDQYQPSYDNQSPPRQGFQKPQGGYQSPSQMPLFGQRVIAGNNCGPTTDKSSVKLHAPPGGKSSIQFF